MLTRAAREDAIDDSVDVPAAVVCAVCGDAGCSGCERELSRSGIVAVVAWERSELGTLDRMWATARATTLTGEAFFELLPDGPIAPALRFAVLVELFAACGFVLTSIPVVVAIAPFWARHVIMDGGARDVAIRVGLVGVPGIALLLVAAHAAFGLALDQGARRAGARPAASRALRFGLYTTGWDLILGPIGALVLAFKESFGAAFALFGAGVGLPGRCTRAFLRGSYRLEGDRADRARRYSTATAIVATLAGAIVIVAAAIALVITTV